MLDLRFVCDNIDLVKKKLAMRNSKLDISEVVELAEKRRAIIREVETLKAEKNKVSAEIAMKKKEQRVLRRPYCENENAGRQN